MGASGTHKTLLWRGGNKFAHMVVLGRRRSNNLRFQLTLLLREAFSAAEIFRKRLQEWQRHMYAINRSTGDVIFFFFNTINFILCQFFIFKNVIRNQEQCAVVSLSNCFHRTLSTPTVILFTASACVGEKGHPLMMLQKKLIHKRLLWCLNCAFNMHGSLSMHWWFCMLRTQLQSYWNWMQLK